MNTINYDDFAKLDIRVATILSVEPIDNSKKLLKIMVDLGSETRQILSGLAHYYKDYSELIGLQVLVLINLEPKEIAGLESQGIILMADNSDKPIQISPVEPVNNGTQIG